MQYTPNSPRAPKKPKVGFLARLRAALLNLPTKADTLLEIGYHFDLDPETRGRVLVTKPGADKPAYDVDISWDAMDCRWRYRCSCAFYKRMVDAQQWDVALEPECKHGRRAMSLFLAALQFVEHVRPLPPMMVGAVVRAQACKHGPQPKVSFDDAHPWPTKRALAVVPAWEALGRMLWQH